MNPNTPFRARGFPGPYAFHQAGPSALQWATFALVLLLVLTVFALLVARFAKGGRRHRGRRFMMRHGGRPDPLEILRMRFAGGQISRDEFLQATADLTASGPPPTTTSSD